MQALPGSIPSILTQAKSVGPHDPAAKLGLLIVLKLRNRPQLDAFLAAVRDPANPLYQHFLTQQEFMAQYDPTDDQVAAVVNYLSDQGIHVTKVAPDNSYIRILDTSATLERVLGVRINDFDYQGRRVYGSLVAPQFPAKLAEDIQGVLGLSNIIQLRSMLGTTSAATGTGRNSALITYYGYTPQDIADAYDWPDITDTANGAGVTIAVATADSASLASSDYTTFWNDYGLPSHTVNFVQVGNPNTTSEGIQETTVDIERAGAMAPGASIRVYDASDATVGSFYQMYDQIITEQQAQVITTSWGVAEIAWNSVNPDSGNSYRDDLDTKFKNAVATGIAIVAAAGDRGSSDCAGLAGCNLTADAGDYPSTDPYVVAVGGTTYTGSNETAWSYDCDTSGKCGATGGADSGEGYFPQQPWEVGPGVPQNGHRSASDISMNADSATFYSAYLNGQWTGVYGTSLGAPQIAALLALRIAHTGGQKLGQANSALYVDANNTSYYTDFHDITSGNNGAFNAGAGWDHPTGWGSPDATQLIAHLGESTLSAPQNLNAEYTQCLNNNDKYFLTWQAGPIGTTTGYEAEYQYVGGNWMNFYYAPGPSAHLSLAPSAHVSVRVRATDGSVWSSYIVQTFWTAPCSPPP